MTRLTKAQRLALKKLYFRGEIAAKGLTYRSFRKSVHPYFDKSGCVMVHWCGMWIGIETDGYTHS